MRKASIFLALLGLAVLGIPAVASAAPEVHLKARAVPIPKNLKTKSGPTWPGTGNILGAPTALEATFTIKGTEYPTATEFPGLPAYEYSPAPLRRVKFYLPKGTKIHTQGFGTCPQRTFEEHLEPPCPKTSLASPPGEARGVVTFATTHVHENVLVQGYFAPGGGLTFWIEGKRPAVIEQFASGGLKPASGPFGEELNTAVPLIEAVPGAPPASAEYINVKVGAALKKGKKLVSYGYMPKSCPKAGFKVKAELWFGAGAESTWQEQTATATAPCPKGSVVSKGKGKKGKGHKGHKASHGNRAHKSSSSKKGKHKAKGHRMHQGKHKAKGRK